MRPAAVLSLLTTHGLPTSAPPQLHPFPIILLIQPSESSCSLLAPLRLCVKPIFFLTPASLKAQSTPRLQAINYPKNPIPQQLRPKIDQQAQPLIRQSKIGQELFLVNRLYRFY